MTPLQFTRGVRSLNRLRHIAQVLTRHGFGHIVTRINLGRHVPIWMLRKKDHPDSAAGVETSVGRRLALAATELGPTFIKLGQMLSSRPDILPETVLRELRTLQDDVPPFDNSVALGIIAEELGRPVTECYASVGVAPIASASIGQVYRAQGNKGEELVIKVRRPDIEDTLRLDLELLEWLAHSLEALIPELAIYRPVVIVSELRQMLTRELDYINEASTTARFHEAFQGDAGLRIPKVYWDLCGPRILTLQAMSGVSLEKILGGFEASEVKIDRHLVARRLVDCYLKQIFEFGTFHADPHPGNILVEPIGNIALIDFGQVGTITDEWRTDLLVMVYAGVEREVGVVIDALGDMGALRAETDHRSLHRALTILLDKYHGLPIKRFDLRMLLTEFSDIIRRHDLLVPRDMLMLIKALSLVATATSRLDPELDLLELLRPRLRKAMAERFSPNSVARGATLFSWHLLSIVRRAPAQLRRGLRRLAAGGWRIYVRHENIDRLINELDRSSNRLAFSIVIAAIIVGSSVVVSANTNRTVWGVAIQTLGILGYLIAGILGISLLWAIFRSGRLH